MRAKRENGGVMGFLFLISIFEKKYLGGRERESVEEWVLGRRREGEERVGGCREGQRERAS